VTRDMIVEVTFGWDLGDALRRAEMIVVLREGEEAVRGLLKCLLRMADVFVC
jgi:hypothetical protein